MYVSEASCSTLSAEAIVVAPLTVGLAALLAGAMLPSSDPSSGTSKPDSVRALVH